MNVPGWSTITALISTRACKDRSGLQRRDRTPHNVSSKSDATGFKVSGSKLDDMGMQ